MLFIDDRGGKLDIKFASTRDDSIFYDAMFSETMMIKGYIRVYRMV